MQWFGRGESDNVEDERGSGGGRGLFLGGGILGLIGAAIYIFTGINPSQLLNQVSNGNTQTEQQAQDPNAPEDNGKKFVRVVLKDTEDIWGKLFRDMGKTYQYPHLVLFTDGVESACGSASSATGPFYCPGDAKVYIDLSFYDELKNRFGAAGDFANAYVIAHEVGHHVQNLLGISAKMDRARSRMSRKAYNKLSVKLELQADFYAGVWAHYEQSVKKVIDEKDIKDALNAANAIGDDRLQQQSQGRVEPDSFTHGTSAQRVYWFKKGYETGDINQGDTFSNGELD
ncbi:KPN_02809 family neutral zinc metallopeptidase [Mucilaginibacter flavus]|uniref:KPN_02809 family neutral zinc metallopeptidase n=1 Tax=Mucilaginibacter flavus TaxID=931504 RepID=UPI0025B36515|nr:neutral zinc metallopeptidase [Mucilaginibacter flavus]MDN3581956.1 neutral zinc metallopeptidase [Mucilaginibacter flavus]